MAELDGPRFGPASKATPKQLVVLCHGLGADGHDLIDLAPTWSHALPDALFVSVDAPFPHESGFGRQWWSVEDRSAAVMEAGVRRAAGFLDRRSAGDQGVDHVVLRRWEGRVGWHAAVAADRHRAIGIERGVELGLLDRIPRRLRITGCRLRLWLWLRWSRRSRLECCPAAMQRIGHEALRAVFGPGRLIGSGGIRVALGPRCLHPLQRPQRAIRLAPHGGGLGVAFQRLRHVRWILPSEAQALVGLGIGGGEPGGEPRLGGSGRQQGGHLGDGVAVAAGDGLGVVAGRRRRQRGVQGVDQHPVGVPRELKGEVGPGCCGWRFHQRNVG